MERNKVVLIAGSYGSLEPLEVILSALPTQSGLTFIILQHLDPAFKSRLPELISGWTSIPCTPIGETTALTPDRIFVASSGEQIKNDGEQLFLIPGADISERSHVIDALAEALANEPGVEPALVVLSGRGNDGLRGAEAVARNQGLVIAQDPAEAAGESMPKSVIDAKLADEVLAVENIAASLVRFASRKVVERLDDPHQTSNEGKQGLQRVLELLQTHLNRDFSDYKEGTLNRRLQRRIRLSDLNTIDDYLTRYANDTAELQQLSDDFLIGVTAFFRDAAAFDVIAKKVLPGLLSRTDADGEFRCWLIGCSTGEEVYSLAMLVLEALKDQGISRRVKLFATDVDSNALDFARLGVYPQESVLAVPEAYRERYFTRQGKHFVVDKAVREMVIFASHNVISDTPFSRLDLIVCRNLIIYLNERMKSALLRLFHSALTEGGFLFLGTAESVGQAQRHFLPVSKKWRIYERSNEAPRKAPPLPIFHRMSDFRRLPSDQDRLSPVALRGEGTLRRLLEDHGTTQLLIDESDRLIYTLGDTSPYLRIPGGEPTNDFMQLVQPSLHLQLRALLNKASQQAYAATDEVVLDEGPLKGEQLMLTASKVAEEGFERCIVVSLSRTGKKQDISTGMHRNASQWTIELLRKEVDATREDMQRTIQKSRASDHVLRQANEEIVAMNEELQSSNEELEASKEEMQSLNDELNNSNAQLEKNSQEVAQLNADLENLLNSSDSATLIVDRERRIRRFTPNLKELMRLRDTDVGRDVGDIFRLFDDAEFLNDIARVVSGELPADVEINLSDDRQLLRRILPYDLPDTKLAGAVINFIDVSELQRVRARDRQRAAQLAWQTELLDAAAPVFGRTLEGAITYWNKCAEELWGYSEEEALGKNAHELLKTSFPSTQDAAQKGLLDDGMWRGVVGQRTKSGRNIELSSSWALTVISNSGRQWVSEVYQDLSITMQLRSALKEEQELFHLLLDWTSNTEYWTDADGNISYITPAVREMTGYSAEEFIETPGLLSGIIAESSRADWLRHVSPEESPAKDQWKTITLPIRKRDGSQVWIEHRFRIMYSSDSKILGYRGTMRDVDEVHKLEKEARDLAFKDPLTNLPNRRMIAVKLDEARTVSNRTYQYGALVMLDIDHFKRVNDTDGHGVGDELLVEVAARLRQRLRSFDTVARVGGDEFLMILNALGQDQMEASLTASRICNEIRADISSEQNLTGASTSHHVTGSFGVALFVGDKETAETLLKQADMALYSAKDNGRNRVKLFDPKMQADVDRRMASETALLGAQESGDLIMYYQLQTDAQGQAKAVEALLRWKKPDGSMASPMEFMDVLEDQPLVSNIGHWVINTCFAQLKQWEADPDLHNLDISINISAGYLVNDSFTKELGQLIESNSVDPRRIILELTENALLVESDRISTLMYKLSARGFRFSLDDFGTGFSSLSHLRDLPLAQLKIDQSFVAGLPDDLNCQSIVKSIVAVGQALNLEVVAEGVETRAQCDFLQSLGCDLYQGYLFAHPVPADKIKLF
ncbi:diguanylate cyclaSe/phosphodiesterase with PAS/PAC sensor(s) [gamma proteobacterium NOR5-3]|nr:diguanylate cyclaSe/phosphodiesterase with PAS/PAC sensor(s) [gamma proteobacterium NOR5-3]